MMLSKRTLSCTAILAVTLLASSARAEPSADDRAVARALFEEGRALLKEGKFAEACPKLEESQRLDGGMGTLYNLADCYEKSGRIASAWAAFAEVADLAKRSGQADREQIARERVAALAPRVSRLKIRMVPPLPQGLELKYDDKLMSNAVLETEIPVDPGEHRVRASAPGKIAAETNVKIEVGAGHTSLDLPALVDAPPSDPAPPPAAPPPKVDEGPKEPPSSWQKTAALGAGGAAIVALGVGTIFGLRAKSQWSEAESSCPNNRCDADGYQKWSDARSSATVGTIGFVAGGVLAAAAVVLFVTAPSSSPPATAAKSDRFIRSQSPIWRMP